jgi:type I restriction enzyme S subunit
LRANRGHFDHPRGYKETEIGEFPAEWGVTRLAEICAFITKGATPTTYGFRWEQSGVRFLRSECVSEDGLDLSQSMFISPEAHWMLRRSEIQDGDILITITGNVGRAIFLSDIGNANINQHIARVRITSSRVDARFVFHFLSQASIRARFSSITTGQAYPQISLQQVRDVLVALPPTRTEQEAIAEALNDADALIESLEQLVAKKRHLKRGAMQELLTGKRRLPGFEVKPGYKQTEMGVIPEDWDVTTVGREFSVQLGKMLDSEKNVGVSKPYLGNRAVQWGRIDLSDIGVIKLTPADCLRYRLRKDDLLVCEGGEIGRAAVWNQPIEECYYQKALHRLRPLHGYNVQLMSYMLQRLAASGFLLNFVTQTSIAHLPKEKLEQVPLPLPPTKAEQTAIARILTDMDAEIAALEARLIKARQLKQGMMQELLTGRIRLI